MGAHQKCGMYRKSAAQAVARKLRRKGYSVRVVFEHGPGPCGGGWHTHINLSKGKRKTKKR